MQKNTQHKLTTKEKQRISALKRDNTNRIKALPRGKNHWNYSENPSKLALHKRLYRKYGKASEHKCVDCNNQARDWSCENENYTDNIKDYRPRCRKCHVKKDENWKKNKSENWKKFKRNTKGQFEKLITN